MARKPPKPTQAHGVRVHRAPSVTGGEELHGVFFARSEARILDCFEAMASLRTHLSRAEFPARISLQMAQGYRLVGLEAEGVVRCVAGFRIFHHLLFGKCLQVDDLATREADRSKGYGRTMLHWLANYGRSQGCAALQLDSGLQREAAHRFYCTQGMRRAAYHFHLPLDGAGPAVTDLR